MVQRTGGVMASSDLKGMAVTSPQGQDLGEIEEIMVNMEDGDIAYAVLSFGGFMGMGDKLFGVSWQALGMSENGRAFVLNVSEETLKGAPGFDKDNWPNEDLNSFANEVRAYWRR